MIGTREQGTFLSHCGWLLGLAIVVAGQIALSLQLFGWDDPLSTLIDNQPIVSGRHPLHLYHASLGAATFQDRYTTLCYDPAFQAGYPKTPVFDGGCRPAETFLILGNDSSNPAAYKIGILTLYVSVPILFALSAWGIGVPRAGWPLAGLLGCAVGWSADCRELLNQGDVDKLLAGLMALLFIAGLARYGRFPGPIAWLMLVVASIFGWYAQPLLWLGMSAIVTLYYLIHAPRHGLAWHLGLVGVGLAGLAPNFWWLWDWARYWWLRQSAMNEHESIPLFDSSIASGFELASIGPLSSIAWIGIGLVLFGCVTMIRRGLKCVAGLLLLSMLLLLLAIKLGPTWTPFRTLGLDSAGTLIEALGCLPLAYLLAVGIERSKLLLLIGFAALFLPLGMAWAPGISGPFAESAGLDLTPLDIGLTREQEQFVEGLRNQTTDEARILFEELPATHHSLHWTAMLPMLTQRNFLGGLDPDASFEYSYCQLRGNMLNGRRLSEWSSDDRAELFQRYNIGWIVCRSDAASAWCRNDPSIQFVERYHDNGELLLFKIVRQSSYVLVGTGSLVRANSDEIVFSDLIPNAAGEIVLSFHHVPNLRVTPTIVHVQTDKDAYDPVPMVKLRIPGPLSRVTLTWDGQ